MKRIILVCAVVVMAVGSIAVFSSNAPAPVELAAPGGSFSQGAFPLFYTRIDTIAGTATDSLKVSMRKNWVTNFDANNVNSITYTVNALKVAGTPTMTICLYGSANNGANYDSVPLMRYTISPGSLTAPVTRTYSVTGNPWTDYCWVASGSASATVAWKDYVLIR